MKLKSMLVLGVLAATGSLAHSQTVYNITGATAFRAAANQAIIALLGGNGVTEYAYTGTAGINGTSRAIFRGNIGGSPVIVRASWSGSTQGILDVADQNAIQFLKTTTTMSTGTGTVNAGAAGDFETAVPRFTFSDVDKLLSARPNSPIQGEGVGVVPFMFVAGESAPAAVTNMTDQIHASLWGSGELRASVFTNNSADDNFTLFATGRNNGSGTRAAVLAETKYGAFTNIIQFDQTFTGDRATGTLTGNVTLFASGGNSGHSGNLGVRELLTRTSNPSFLGGRYAFLSYLTISDAETATGYNQLTGAVSGGEGAKPMTYNGVRYSEANVYNGSYTLWSYQQLYRAASPTAAENTFFNNLKGQIDGVLTPNLGLKTSLMRVERAGGDGGPVNPL
ncbi:MAG: hypothetical protein EOP85_01675 [Verrucomicrobiaceae bacterium]|nr:MAG: hypothetical protein EOP85_01675 [Verrucomicrobiaceae bacterium]